MSSILSVDTWVSPFNATHFMIGALRKTRNFIKIVLIRISSFSLPTLLHIFLLSKWLLAVFDKKFNKISN